MPGWARLRALLSFAFGVIPLSGVNPQACQRFVNKNLQVTTVFYLSVGRKMGTSGAFWGTAQSQPWALPA